MKMTIYNEPLWYKEWRDLGFECVNGPKPSSLNIPQKTSLNYWGELCPQ